VSQIHNERVKLLATYVNGMGIAVFALGTLAPIFSYLFGTMTNPRAGYIAIVSLVCFLASAALHFLASQVLRRIRP
jgi:hypothetical protein